MLPLVFQSPLSQREPSAWPIALLLSGIALMLVAARYSAIKMTLTRMLRRKS